MLVSVHSHDHSLTLGNKSSLHHKRVLQLIRTHMQKHAVTHPHLLTHRWESFCFVFRLQSRLSQQQVKLSVNCSPRAGLLYSVLSAVWSCLNAWALNILKIGFVFTINPLMPLVFNTICMKTLIASDTLCMSEQLPDIWYCIYLHKLFLFSLIYIHFIQLLYILCTYSHA